MKQIAVLVDQAETVMERFCRVIAFISMAVIFVVLTLNVFARYLGVERLQVGSEIPEVLFPWLVASSVGLAAIHGAHISILLLADRASESVMQFVGTAMSLVTISLYLAWSEHRDGFNANCERRQITDVGHLAWLDVCCDRRLVPFDHH